MILKKYIGDKAFYKAALAVALPMIIQNTFTNLVNLLDNIMVGKLVEEAMSGVAIVNQFIFVFNLAIFGAISGAGIFTAQFNGNGDIHGVKNTMRLKLLTCLVLGIAGIIIFSSFDDLLINSFLHESDSEGDLALTLQLGKDYLTYILIGLVPFAISQAYSSTMRETGDTIVPMIASVASVITNFVLNAILIFGLLGAPALGVVGAAIATSTSRFVELGILVVWSHTHKEKYRFIKNLYTRFVIPFSLFKQVAIKGMPILFNELFWSLSVTIKNQCFSTRGLDVVTATNIAFTLQNLLSVAYFALSSAIAIMVGNLLGAGKLEEARDTDRKLLAFAVFTGGIMMCIQICLAPIFPAIYDDASNSAKDLATFIMVCYGLSMPLAALATSTYYTIRSGGLVFITMLFDSVYAWVLVTPVAALLAYFTNIPFTAMLPIVIIVENIKLVPGLILVNKGIWLKQITAKE